MWTASTLSTSTFVHPLNGDPMNQQPVRTALVAGPAELLAAMVSNYNCGSCNGEVETIASDGETSTLRAYVRHDDNCPVLNGHVSPIPDTFRAATRLHP